MMKKLLFVLGFGIAVASCGNGSTEKTNSDSLLTDTQSVSKDSSLTPSTDSVKAQVVSDSTSKSSTDSAK